MALVSIGCGYDSQVASENYDIEVVANDITMVDGLAFHPTGAILATQEYRGGGVVRIDPVSGSSTYVVRGLADPDNIVVVGGDIYVTEEDAAGRILRIDFAERTNTFVGGLNNPEGLDLGPDGNFYVAEHAPGGRVLRVSPAGELTTIGKCANGEGLRLLPDGSVVVAETSADRLTRYFEDGSTTRLAEGAVRSPDGVAVRPSDGAVLVTEDRGPGRMIAIDPDTGDVIETLATGMSMPQTMLVEPDGAILVAEQGEDRILRLRPKTGATP